MTAMDAAHDKDLGMPRLEDGMLDLRELGRTLVETLVDETMGAQADNALQRRQRPQRIP